MSFHYNCSDKHSDENHDWNQACKTGRTIASDPTEMETLTPLAESGKSSNDTFLFVTKSDPGLMQRSCEENHHNEDDSSAKTEESSDELSSPFVTFDYGELDAFLSTLEIQSNQPASPLGNNGDTGSSFSGRTPVYSPTSTIKELPSSSGAAKVVESSVSGGIVNKSSKSLEQLSRASAAGNKLSQWLVDFLSKLQRDASRRRIADAPFYQPQCKFFLSESTYWSLRDSDWMIQECIWATTFRWVCTMSSPWLSYHRLAFLEWQIGHASKRSAATQSSQASCTYSKYRYNLLDIIRGKAGYMTTQYRAGQRLDRIETRRRELLAIVPYGSNKHHQHFESNHANPKEIPQEIWETALMVGCCAWQHYQARHQKNDSEKPQSAQSDKCTRLNDDWMTVHPQEFDQENENDRIAIQVQPTEGLEQKPTQESALRSMETKQQSSRKNKTHKDDSCDSEIPLKRLKTDLNNVLLQEKSRRIKARAKELSMLQRFGLCSGQNPKEDSLSESVKADIVDDTKFERSECITMNETRKMRFSSQIDRIGPPLRFGSPSSLDRKLKRIRPPSTGGTISKEQQLAKKTKRKHDTGSVLNEDPSTVAHMRQLSSLPQTGAEEGRDSVVDSKEAALPCQSPPPKGTLVQSALEYDDTLSMHSRKDSPIHVSADTESHVGSVVQKRNPLATRSSPLSYDDDVELSELAKAMLQAVENKRFQRDKADLSNNNLRQASQTETVVTRKLSKVEWKQQRKEAKEKRKAEKKQRKYAKHSNKHSKKHPNSTLVVSSRSSSAASCHRSDGDQRPNANETLVDKQTHKPTKPKVKHLGKIDLDFSTGVSRIPTTCQKDFHIDHSIPSQTDTRSKRQQYRSTSPELEAMIIQSHLTPPANSSSQASANVVTNVENKTRQQQENLPFRLLCSESFVEQWGDIAARLATGSWGVPSEGTRICFLDTSLIDHVGVDIETEAQGAVIVCLLSATVRSGFSHLLTRVVDIASQSRYNTLDVVICVDIDDEASTNGVTRLQNAIMRHRGAPQTFVDIRLVSLRSLANCLVDILLVEGNASGQTDDDFSFIEHHIGIQKTRDRLHFLLSIVPSLSVRKAFQIVGLLSGADQSDSWLQRLFDGVKMENSPFTDIIPTKVHEQLSFALSTPLGPKASNLL